MASVNDIPDDVLLRRAVANCRARHCRKGEAHPRRTAVMDTFALGSSYSMQLCLRFGLDPDESVKR
jgi:hypothetical protein